MKKDGCKSKKYPARLSALLLSGCLTVSLTGCLAVFSKGDAKEITAEEVETLLDDYLEFERYTTYDTPSLEADWDHPIDVKGKSHRYSKVTDPRFDAWEEWTAFAGSIFAGQYLIRRFNEQDHFLNLDGDTYCFGVTEPWELSPEYAYEITHAGDGGTVVEMRRVARGAGDEGADVTHSDFFEITETANGWRITGEAVPENP